MPRTRIRADYRFGTLSASVAAGDTSVSSGALANFPAIDSTNEFAAVTLLDAASGSFEILYVTAHAAGATTATVERGCEGSTAQAWSSGAAWLHGPTKADFQSGIDAPWPGSLGYDLEFEGYSTALPSGWTWVNQGTSTFSQQGGVGVLTSQPATGVDGGQRLLVRSLPTQASWAAIAKCGLIGPVATGPRGPSLALRESSSGKFIELGPNLTSLEIECNKWTTLSTFNSASAPSVVYGVQASGYYLQVRRNSATSYDFLVSNDGANWITHAAAIDVSAFMTPDQIGFLVSGGNNFYRAGSLHWFRVR